MRVAVGGENVRFSALAHPALADHLRRLARAYRWWRVWMAAALVVLLTACQTPAPVGRPCGVIRDSLATVQATTPAGQQRLDVHYERGRAAGCW